MIVLGEKFKKKKNELPERRSWWELVPSGTLSDRSHGCSPKKVKIFLTAVSSVGRAGKEKVSWTFVGRAHLFPGGAERCFCNALHMVRNADFYIFQLFKKKKKSHYDGWYRKKKKCIPHNRLRSPCLNQVHQSLDRSPSQWISEWRCRILHSTNWKK